MNFTYTTNPGYTDLFYDLFKAIQWHYREENWGDYKFPEGFFYDMKRYFNSPLDESYPVLYIAIVFTIIRHGFETLLCKVCIKSSKHSIFSYMIQMVTSIFIIIAAHEFFEYR